MNMRSVNEDQSWTAKALCASTEPDALFVQGASQRQARQICLGCQVRLECLADALQSEADFGVWGGLTERERRAMLRHYTEVEDWKEWIFHSSDPLAEELRCSRSPKVLALVKA